LKTNNLTTYLLFFLITIVAFWQITLFVHPVKYDMIDCYFPWRFYIGECLQHGKFPFWNPYQDLGYPIHADPSSGVWYPFVWIIGYFFGYNVYTIGMEMCIHVFIAAIGFYKLAKTLNLTNHVAVIAAVCYMLCGVFVGNAQHLTYTISACWIPFIINYYIKLSEQKTFLNAIKTAIPLFLIITGGYPAFTFIFFYLMLLLFFYFGIKIFKENRKELLPFFYRNFLFIFFTVLLSSGILISVLQVMPYLSRTNSFTLANALFCPFSPQSMVSFLLPFATLKNVEFFNTDFSMSNAYFGILMFVFFVGGIFIRKPTIYNVLFGFALFSLLASFGKYLPVREFLFEHLPLMNLYRFPSVFRLFTIIGFILTGAFCFDKFLKQEFEKTTKNLKIVLIVMIIAFLITIIVLRIVGYLNMVEFIKNDLLIASTTSTIIQHVTFQSIIQIIILFSFLMIVWKIKEKKRFVNITIGIIVIELIISTQLNAPYTVYSAEFSAKETNHHIKKFPSGFPQLPDIAIDKVNSAEVYFGPFWRNVNIFQKQISSTSFNSFTFLGHQKFIDTTPQLYNEILKNKIVFLSETFFKESDVEKIKKDSMFTSKMLFFNSEEYNKIALNKLKHTSGDSARLVYFAPDSFIVKVISKKSQLLTLLQNNYSGWQVFLNRQPLPIYTSNKSLMSVVVPSGTNEISFIYTNWQVIIACWISIISLVLALGIIVISTFKR